MEDMKYKMIKQKVKPLAVSTPDTFPRPAIQKEKLEYKLMELYYKNHTRLSCFHKSPRERTLLSGRHALSGRGELLKLLRLTSQD